MPIVLENATPGTLADVLGQIVDAFEAMGNATIIQIGKQYLESFGVGSPPKIVFVPDSGGSIGPPHEMGRAAGIEHGCDVYVRAAPGDGAGPEADIQHFREVTALGDLVISCIATACSGQLEWGGNYGDSSPNAVDVAGVELSFSFRYKRDVQHSSARWSLDPATEDSSSATPQPPPGEAGTVEEVDITISPVEGAP